MKFEQALSLLKQGHKLTNPSLLEDYEYIQLANDVVSPYIGHYSKNTFIDEYIFSGSDLLNDDWVDLSNPEKNENET